VGCGLGCKRHRSTCKIYATYELEICPWRCGGGGAGGGAGRLRTRGPRYKRVELWVETEASEGNGVYFEVIYIALQLRRMIHIE